MTLRLRVEFSDNVTITPAEMRDHSFTVTGGRVVDASKVRESPGAVQSCFDRFKRPCDTTPRDSDPARDDLWDVSIQPTTTGDMTVRLAGGRACTVDGAICGSGNRPLSNTLSLAIARPPDDDSRSNAHTLGSDGDFDDPIWDWHSLTNNVDYFRFTLTSRREIGIGLRRHTADVDLALLNDVGNTIATSNNSGTNWESITRRLDAGTYFVKATGAASNTRTRYVLRWGP